MSRSADDQGPGRDRHITPLDLQQVERPWGGTGLPALGLPAADGRRIGEWWLPTDELGLLVKIIDAREHLSIQLHPDDATARSMGLENGKAEAWYVLDTDPDAVLWVGVQEGIDDQALLRAARKGEDVSGMLNRVPVRPGMVINVPPGTVHAIGAGVVLLEVQQISDTTFRLFDWNRLPPRPLHLEQAKAALRRDPGGGLVSSPEAPPPGKNGVTLLLRTSLFELAALELTAPFETGPIDRPEVWFAEAGQAVFRTGKEELALPAGRFCRISTISCRLTPAPVGSGTSARLIRIRAV
ncbi:MAG: class I mannose-6-phosphate isomerase [Planctomycetota bacterium]